ncbi:MAG: DUF2975 domain-containing protein, partial [Actinomycetota bacterium]|nr:DUF2975 domain-containing protein [Actinomycetota bacterium]
VQAGERCLMSNKAMSWVSGLLLLVALFGLWEAGSQLVDTLRGPGIEVGVRVPENILGAALAQLPVPPGATLRSGTSYGGAAELATPELPLGLRLLAGAGALVGQLAWVAGALYVRRMLLAIEGGEPFTQRNAGRLVRVAGLVLLGGVVAPWLSHWGDLAVHTYLGLEDLVLAPGVDLEANVGFTALLLALVVLAAAEAFRRGRKLTEDTERIA